MGQHVYIGMLNIALTGPQKATLNQALSALGPASDGQPARLNHKRVRLDDDAVIFECFWGDNDLTIANLKQYLANVFGVNVSLITHALSAQSFSAGGTTAILLLTYLTIDRIRFALFGGQGATHEQSRAETIAYLKQSAAAWGDI